MRGRLGQGNTICPAVTVGRQRCTVLHCVTGREDQDRARALQHYRQSLVTLCYTALFCVTGGKDQDRDLQYYRQSLVTLCYRLGGPGQSVTVLPPVTGYTVLHFVTGGEDQDRALQYYRQSFVTLCYTALQAGRTRTERYSITASSLLHCVTLRYRRGGPGQSVTVLPPVVCYTVLHCVTGGEDQDRALQYYRQSLVERRRYADVAPGDLVAPLNNVAMQYSRRGDFGTSREVDVGKGGVGGSWRGFGGWGWGQGAGARVCVCVCVCVCV